MTHPTLQFLGGVRSVTGSAFCLRTPDATVLIECGLFQGLKADRLRNRRPLPFDPGAVDAMVVTHAHVDHIGLLPRVAAEGFDGPVFCTPDTMALASIVLPDAGHLQEEEAAFAARAGYSRHAVPLPLYTEADARASLDLLRPVPFERPVTVAPGVEVVLRPAGHILGSAIATLEFPADGRTATLTTSGDLGRSGHPLLVPPAALPPSDWLLVESTYGDRRHGDIDGALERLAHTIRVTVARGGTVVIPAFAVDRTEVVLVHLARLMAAGAVPEVPVHVDSPMALAALDIYRQARRHGRPDVRAELTHGEDPFAALDLREVRDVEGSKRLDEPFGPGAGSIIVSASGMATGGRVLHHLARYLPDPDSAVVLVGYQAIGTRGRSLADGATEVKMFGRYVPVRAQVGVLDDLSVHADAAELTDWVAAAAAPPTTTFVVHGEPDASSALARSIAARTGGLAVVPRLEEIVRLDPNGHRARGVAPLDAGRSRERAVGASGEG